ncbi:MAG: hypothetical protein PHY59_08695 [Methanobacterium sp.]|nr:hypothetical protein [Methanobacterium sp.]
MISMKDHYLNSWVFLLKNLSEFKIPILLLTILNILAAIIALKWNATTNWSVNSIEHLIFGIFTVLFLNLILSVFITNITRKNMGKQILNKEDILGTILKTFFLNILLFLVLLLVFLFVSYLAGFTNNPVNHINLYFDGNSQVLVILESLGLVMLFSLFILPSMINRNSLIGSIKESIVLVGNNKVKSLILLFTIILAVLISFIPFFGLISGFTITYLTILTTQIYVDLNPIE